jgi:hypothetical protein
MAVSPSTTVRTEMVDLISRELLGPRRGDREEIRGTPRAAYAIGALAPVTVDPSLPVALTISDEVMPGESESVVSDIDPAALGQQGVGAATDEDVSSGDAEEDEDEGPKGALTHPSSMGLRFQVPPACPTLEVVASWGRYESFRREAEDGRKQTWWRRSPKAVTTAIGVASRPARDEEQVELDGDVSLRCEFFTMADRIIVEVALSNDRVTPINAPPGDWLFQTQLVIRAGDQSAIFLPSRDVMLPSYDETDGERRRLDLQYRDCLEYAVGRTCSVSWDEVAHARRACEVSTTWLATADIAQTVAGEVEGAQLAMRVLAQVPPGEVGAGLSPLVTGYQAWLVDQGRRAEELPAHLEGVASEVIVEAQEAATRLQAGLDLLADSPEALRAFHFMNRAMRDQRIRSQVAGQRAASESMSLEAALAAVEADGDQAASWRPFQLAFILMQLPALVDPTNIFRSGKSPRAEVLFFPTGGGKTEAYLGLAAFTFAIRRLQGNVDTGKGTLNGRDGVAVLMRYTLRLLTSQQFQRATALVCAAELIRQEDPVTWGSEPFRIGLWVGSTVSPKRYDEARDQVAAVRAQDSGRTFGLTVLQVKRCPWCGTSIEPKRDVEARDKTRRVVVYCGDISGDCPFSKEGATTEGLPILTVDEEIYRYPPTFLLATVDKFARLAREGEAASLFGYVAERCPRHGYRHPDTRDSVCSGSSHKQVKGINPLPPVTVSGVRRLRPPDLIIQDELHLITGALGTAVGVFENVIDTLCTWQLVGQTVKPLLVASTATMSNAGEQVRNLYGRGLDVFPPQVLHVTDTFFSRVIAVTDETPGRRYLGLAAHGIRLTLAEIRISEIMLLVGQKLLDECGDAADPYLTSVAYFSATRELAGMRRYLDDDVTMRVAGNTEPFPRRTTDFAGLEIGELTSRISSGDIASTLDRLALRFDASKHSTTARAARSAAIKRGEKPEALGTRPFDFVLATSMLQVGVDVPRLGLMLVVGQPKNTAEYIQASSRVGRDPARPGLVLSLANWARPRDMAHFEQFRHYHETFYAQVEVLSVTPYSDTALERGLMAVLVSAARVLDVGHDASLSPEPGAGRVLSESARIDAMIETLAERAACAGRDPDTADRVRAKLIQRRARWFERAEEEGGALVYERSTDTRQVLKPLLISPEARNTPPEEKFLVVANSMREVQPEINLLVSPSTDRLAAKEPPGAPAWTFPTPEDAE